MDLESVAEELYGLVPGEFTRRRDARALEARRAGDRDLATTVKALRRPTTSAWLANLLVRERPDRAANLVDLGTAMRQAQADLAGADLRRLSKKRHGVVAALAQEALRLARDLGEPVSSAASKELTETLEAAVFDAGAAAALRSGRLTMALRYSGLGAVDLTGAVGPHPVPSPSGPATPAPPDRRHDPDGHEAEAAAGKVEAAAAAARVEVEANAAADKVEAAEAATKAEVEAAQAEIEAAEVEAATAEKEALGLGQRVTEALQELDRIQAAIADVSDELERLRTAEAQAHTGMDGLKKAYDAAEAMSVAARQRVGDANLALERVKGRRGIAP